MVLILYMTLSKFSENMLIWLVFCVEHESEIIFPIRGVATKMATLNFHLQLYFIRSKYTLFSTFDFVINISL